MKTSNNKMKNAKTNLFSARLTSLGWHGEGSLVGRTASRIVVVPLVLVWLAGVVMSVTLGAAARRGSLVLLGIHFVLGEDEPQELLLVLHILGQEAVYLGTL